MQWRCLFCDVPYETIHCPICGLEAGFEAPSPEEIEAQTAAIRATWTATERRRRETMTHAPPVDLEAMRIPRLGELRRAEN